MGNFELKCVKICSGLNFSFEAQHSVHLVSQQKLFSPGRMSHDVIVTGFFFFFTSWATSDSLSTTQEYIRARRKEAGCQRQRNQHEKAFYD